MENKETKSGFSGLLDLVSDVSDSDEPTKPEPKAKINPSASKQPSDLQRESVSSKIEQKHTSSTPPIEIVNSEKGNGISVGSLILGIICIVFLIWFLNNGEQDNKKPSHNASSSLKRYSRPESSFFPSVQTSNAIRNAGLQSTKPRVGTNNVLSVSEIRWCIREDIRIEAMREVIATNEGVDEFNRIVNDYNSRCGSYRYRQGSQSRAKSDIEPYRSQIVSEAIRDARQLDRTYQQQSEPLNPNVHYTKEAQQLLTDLGYDPGPVDGMNGRRTANAVKHFQRDVGETQDGRIDEGLLNKLRRAKSAD